MANEEHGTNKEANPKLFLVHTVGGETIRVDADSMFINKEEDRIYFSDRDSRLIEQWTIFMHGVAIIQETTKRKGPSLIG